jgi:hypothetical protein
MDRAAQVVAPPANPSTDYDQQLTFSGTPFQGDWQGVGADYSALPGYGLSAAQLSADLDRVATSGVKIVSTWFDTGWAYTAGYPTGSPDWSSAKMIEFYAYLSGLKARGVKVMIKMGWHFPQNVGAASGTAPITPTPANEATFAAWVSESLNQVINVRGFTNVIGCLFFTEPSSVQVGFIPPPTRPSTTTRTSSPSCATRSSPTTRAAFRSVRGSG